MSTSRQARPLLVFIGVLFSFFVAEAVLVSAQLQQILKDTFQHETTSQLEVMADSAYESVLKADYVTIRTFIERWSASHPEYIELRAIAPNGFIIAERARPIPPEARTITLSKTLNLDDRELLRLELVADSNPSVSAIASSLRNRLYLCAVLFTTILGVVLWRALQTMAIQPLEREIIRRTEAEEELRRAHDQLEVTVQERTADLRLELAERRRVEAELVQREERIRLLLDSTAEGIFGADATGRCTFCNPSALRLLGYEQEADLLGMDMHALIHCRADGSPSSPQESIISQAYLTGRGCHSDQDLFRRRDDSSFPVECWSYPIRDDAGLPQGTVVTFIDITDRKRLESQLVQSRKMEAIGTLAGGIAHDFNNILAPIMGYLELAMMKIDPHSKVEAYLQAIHQASCRARDLVKQILTFSRRDAEELSPVEVNLLVKEALKLLKASLPSTIEIRQNLDSRCGRVMADPTKIHQVVMNLGTNAYQAMGDSGGVLTVATRPLAIAGEGQDSQSLGLKPGNYLVLEIGDTGPGMEAVTLERIFEPYFSTKPTGQGTGMGLAVVHGIVNHYGGKITVESASGRGTTFHLYLPVIAAGGLIPDATGSAAPLPTGTERVLLVDDEEYVLEVEAELLESLGYRVRALASPLDALAEFTLHREAYDLVITDMTMPRMTGDRLAKKILALRPGLPIVICTGFSHLISEETVGAAGIKGYIAKPVTLVALANTVRHALDGRGG